MSSGKLIFQLMVLGLFVSCKTKEASKSHTTEQQSGSQNAVESIISETLSEFMKPPYTALSGAIYIKGKTYQFHFGELTDGTKPYNQTLYEIGSVTKTYTGLLLSQAVYENKVKLDDDIRGYLRGNYPNLILENNRPITLSNLITHTSGLPMNINCDKNGQTITEQLSCFKTFTKEDFFEKLKQIELKDKSGNEYHYSNSGIQLVGYILENVYQSSFEKLLKEYVFSRLEEENTYAKVPASLQPKLALGKNSNGELMPIENGFYEYAGGLKSSTNSMLKYMKMYLESNDPVIKQSMNLLAGNNKYGRAFAWNTFEFDTSNKMLYHNGGTFGQSSWIALYPNKKIGIFLVTSVMTENSQDKLNELSNKIIDQIIKNAT